MRISSGSVGSRGRDQNGSGVKRARIEFIDGTEAPEVMAQELQMTDLSEDVEDYQQKKPWHRYLEAGLGLREYWYPAAFSSELAEGQTLAVTMLGERILIKRAGGQVYAVADRCPHRGVPFSARPECYTENTLTCWFHGFTFDVRDGKLVQILTEEDSALVGKLEVPTYPVFERNQTIFVFIGDGEATAPELDIQPLFFERHLAFHPLVRHKIRCDWRIAAENGFDAAHIYGHRTAEIFRRMPNIPIPLGTYPSTKAVVTAMEDDDAPKGIVKDDDVLVFAQQIEGVDVRAANYPPDAPAVVRDHRTRADGSRATVSCFMPCGLQVTGFPLPKMVHFEWYVPIDENHHMYTILLSQEVSSPEEERLFHEECESTWGPLLYQPPGVEPEGFNNFDGFGRFHTNHAYSEEGWWLRERLFKPDYIIMEWRRVVAKHARAIQTGRGWAPVQDAGREEIVWDKLREPWWEKGPIGEGGGS